MAYSYGMSFKSPMQEKTPEDWKKKVNDLFDQPPSIEDWQKQVNDLPDWQSAGKLYNSMPSLGSVASRRKANPYWGSEYRDIIRENPHWQEWARRLHEVNKNRGGLLHSIGRSLSDYPGSVGSLFNTYQGREMAIKAGLFAAGMAGLAGAGGAFAGGGAAGGAGGGAAAGGGLTAGQAAAAGVDPFLAGGGLAAGGAGMGAGGALGAAGAAGGSSGGAAMAAGAGGGGFPWAPVIQGGSQLLSGYMDKRASDKASNQQKKNTQAALAQLSPEAIRQLVQMFYTQNYAMLNPAMQSAQRGVAAGAARTGLTGAGVTRQLQAGIPGQFANMALGQASQQGLNVAGQRAGIYSGAPVSTPYSFGNDLQGIMQMLGRYGILRNNQQQTNQPSAQNQWWISGPGYDDNEYR